VHKTIRQFTTAISLGVVGSLGLGFGLPGSATAETITLRYNQWFPTGHWSQASGMYPWFEEIAAVTEGRVVIEPSAKPLAPPNRNYQAVVDGIADVAWGPHGYTPGVFPLTEMVEMPFITFDAGKSSRVYWKLWKEYFEPTGMQSDVVTLAMHVTAGGNFSMRDEAVTSLADLSGKKIRVPTPLVGRALSKAEAVPVSGSLTELREMLSRGLVDGTVISDELVTGFKVDGSINNVTNIPGGIFSNSAFIIMNKDKWEQISEEDRTAILAISGEELSYNMGSLWQANDIFARQKFEERLGDDYVIASDAFLAELQGLFNDEETEWKETATNLGVDADAAIAFYRDRVAQGGQ